MIADLPLVYPRRGRTHTAAQSTRLLWGQAMASPAVVYYGPYCMTWSQHERVCPHDSCWDIVTEGASEWFRDHVNANED